MKLQQKKTCWKGTGFWG